MNNKNEALEYLGKRIEKWTKRGNEKLTAKYTELYVLFSSASDRFYRWVGDNYITMMNDDMREILKKQIKELN